MKLIVGLGNPGTKFKNNRHNLGFMVADVFVIEEGLSWKKSRDLMCFFAKTREYVLVKPTTYVNESGESIRAVVDYYDIVPLDVLVVCDDLDLEFGMIRLSFGGSSAGHRGVESVVKGLGTGDFARLRIGINHPKNPNQDPADYVLSDFTNDQKNQLPEIIAKCQEAIRSYIDDGVEATMNKFN